MKEPILKAVANPPKILWAPYLPVLLNLGLQSPIMMMCIGVFGMNPLMFMVTLPITHMVIIAYGAKEPHLSGMIQAFGSCSSGTNNMYKVKGKKFAP